MALSKSYLPQIILLLIYCCQLIDGSYYHQQQHRQHQLLQQNNPFNQNQNQNQISAQQQQELLASNQQQQGVITNSQVVVDNNNNNQQQQLPNEQVQNPLPGSSSSSSSGSISSTTTTTTNNNNNNNQQNESYDNNNNQQQQSGPTAGASLSHGLRIERDGPIFRLNGLPQNSTTIKLVWSLKSGTHADSFDIIYGPLPEATNLHKIEKINGTARDYTVYNLLPDQLYQFQLLGYLGNSLYEKEKLTIVKTPPLSGNNVLLKSQQDTISSNIMPLGVKAEAKLNNSIQLSWTEADKPAGVKNSSKVNIIRYYISPSLSTASSNNNNNNLASGQQASNTNTNETLSAHLMPPQYHYLNITNDRASRVMIQKLKPGTEYAFAVRTVYFSPDMKKILLQSMFSMDTIAKTFDLEPSAPRNFTIKTQLPTSLINNNLKEDGTEANNTIQELRLELSWLPPESPNGQLKGYVILYAYDLELPDERWSRIDIKDATINTWYVSNLKPGVSYYFKIRAINQKGQSNDSDVRLYVAPLLQQQQTNIDKMSTASIPYNSKLMIFVFACLVIIAILISCIFKLKSCSNRKKGHRKGSMNNNNNNNQQQQQKQKNLLTNNSILNDSINGAKLNGFSSTNSSSTVTARVGTLARRNRDNDNNGNNKQDFWINAMDQQQDIKSNASEKSAGDMNMAMVSIQTRNSPSAQFATTQLAPALPEYRFANSTLQQNSNDQLMMQQLQLQQQQQQQSHYHQGQFGAGTLGFDQMDNATASALMTLTKRQQQQMQKYQIQFATTGNMNPILNNSNNPNNQQQAPSPHQQPPPPPPLNIEQQQSLYGTTNNRSLRLHRPAVYDPVSGSFVSSLTEAGPPNYNSTHMNNTIQSHHHHHHPMAQFGQQNNNINSNTLQFHPHQSSTLLSRRSTNTLRSFQTTNPNNNHTLQQATYGQLMGAQANHLTAFGQNTNQHNSVGTTLNGTGSIQPQQLLQSHQAVINQLNNSTYPSLPLKHVSAVRPQIMSSLEDQIEMELAEKEHQQQDQQQQQQQEQQQQQQVQQQQQQVQQQQQ